MRTAGRAILFGNGRRLRVLDGVPFGEEDVEQPSGRAIDPLGLCGFAHARPSIVG